MTSLPTSARVGKRPGGDPARGEAHGARAHQGGPLGTNAKYVVSNPETGEIEGFDPMALRAMRFALQSAARYILPKSRTAKCLRLRRGGADVQVWRSREHGTASYSGLQTCGSVWACPVCASKIAERRRAELMGAMAAHKAGGGSMLMLTLTTPHQRGDVLADLLAKQSKALQRFWGDKTVRGLLAGLGVLGQVRALEVTHGRKSPQNNGWHPHYHVLLFAGSGVDLTKDWAVRLYLRWAAICEKAGLGVPSFAHGLKLDDGSKAAAYASKWGLEDEMTKGHTKKGKTGGETPFDFLRAFLADSGDLQAAALFREFAETFKGKRQLHWSHGLKARFAVEDVTDDQLAERIEDSADYLGSLTLDQWRDVLAVEGRANVLACAASGGWPAVVAYLDAIKGAGAAPGGFPLGSPPGGASSP